MSATADQTGALTAATFNSSAFRGAVALRRRAARVGADVGMLAGVIFAVPFVILAIGIPVALFVQLLLWILRLL